jgi:two-component system sensor histidine kinase TctE
MADSPREADSLRRLLLRFLVAPLVAVLVTGGFAAYTLTVRIASEAYDSALLDPALALAERLRLAGDRVELDLPAGVLEALRVDTQDRMYFAVHYRDALIGGTAELARPPRAPEPGAPVFYDSAVRGEGVRAAAMAVRTPAGDAQVLVAETLRKRHALMRNALIASTLPELAVALCALGVVWFGVRRGLAPLETLRAEIGARSHRDLRAVSEAHAPAEVRPLVAELNELLARLRTALDAQSRFIADAAHQLRTPLAALQAQVEAARRETGAAEREAALARLDAATRRTARLASQLLALARVDPSGDAPLADERVDLQHVVGTHIDDWLQRADAAAIDLGFELEHAPTRGDAGLLGELATNLVENALAYSPRGATVTVRTAVRGGDALLEVEDNGPGIPAAERDRVFERFHRLPGARAGGSGLGLAIVREIAQRHGATVTLADGASSRGTLVQVRFDSAPDAPAAPPAQQLPRVVSPL